VKECIFFLTKQASCIDTAVLADDADSKMCVEYEHGHVISMCYTVLLRGVVHLGCCLCVLTWVPAVPS
jgi:hypothetical protein